MSSDLRFHIATLAAVFFALGIGILIGAGFVGAPVVSRQTTLIRRLEGNVNELRRETREARRNEEALQLLLPGIVQGKLTNRRVLVVQTGPYAEAVERAVEALRLAGAQVTQIALPAGAWRQRSVGPDAAGDDPATTAAATTAEEDIAAEARRLAPLLVSGAQGDAALQPYRSNGRLTGDRLGSGGPMRYVALVGGAGIRKPGNGPAASATGEPWETVLARRRDVTLAEAWQAQGVTVVGVEPVAAELSLMRTYQNAGIATIDDIDRAAGQMALPFALLGEKGAYGVKETADRVLPESLEALPETAAPPADLPARPDSAAP